MPEVSCIVDLNCAHPGCHWDYAQPLNRDLGIADNKIETFLTNTGGLMEIQGRGSIVVRLLV